MVGIAGADLHLEAEAVGIAGLGQQLLGLVRIVVEQLLDARRHRLERLEVAVVVGMLGIGEQLGVAVVVGADDLLLVHRHVERTAHADVVERLGVDPHGQERPPTCRATCDHLSCGALFFSSVDVLPADGLEDVELAGAQRGDAASPRP